MILLFIFLLKSLINTSIKWGGGELKNYKETKKSLFTDRSPDSTDKSLKVT